MLKGPGNVFEPDFDVVIVANRVKVDKVAFRLGGLMRLHRSTTANEETAASQEALP